MRTQKSFSSAMAYHDTTFLATASILSLGFCFAVSIAVAHTPPDDLKKASANSIELRSIGDLRRDLKAFMKNSKRDQEPAVQNAAIYNLCKFHHYVVSDPRFEESQKLQGMRVVAANRLETFKKDFEKQKMRAERKRKSAEQDASNSAQNLTKPVEDSKGSDDQALPTEGASSSKVLSDEPSDNDIYNAAASAHHAMNSFSGGPGQVFNYAGGSFAPPWDHGEDLVDLIENTINPQFWRNNGGSGSIHYFRPLRVLVVGASAQVQDEAVELLYRIRQAGQ